MSETASPDTPGKARLDYTGDPEPDHLRRYANAFRVLAQRFQSPLRGPQQHSVAALRWNLCLGWGVQAARLLCRCLDHNAFSKFAYSSARVRWDKRRTTVCDIKILRLLTEIAVSNLDLPLTIFSADEQDAWAIERTRTSEPMVPSETEAEPDPTDEELIESLQSMLAEPPSRNEERERIRDEHIMLLLTWYASIRWWLAPSFPARFRGDWEDVFHPWVEQFNFPPPVGPDPRGKLPEFSADPSVPVEEVARLILEAQAEIQAQACVVLGDILEFEATSFEDGSRPSIIRRLTGVRAALVAVDRGLSQLLEHRTAGITDPTYVDELYARLDREWIPSFEQSTTDCRRQLATVLHERGRSDIRVHELARRLDVCARDVLLTARFNPEGTDPLKRMARQFANAASDARVLLDALNNALDGVDADDLGAESGANEPPHSKTPVCDAEPSEHPSSGAAEEPVLSTMEQHIVDALRHGARLTTELLAKKAGYPSHSTFKGALAGMVRRGILVNLNDQKGRGYELGPQFQLLYPPDNSPDKSPD